MHTVNVVRDRPDLPALEEELKGLGADVVTTEERLKGDLAASGLPRPALALNCVGGSSSAAVAKALACGLCSRQTPPSSLRAPPPKKYARC